MILAEMPMRGNKFPPAFVKAVGLWMISLTAFAMGAKI